MTKRQGNVLIWMLYFLWAFQIVIGTDEDSFGVFFAMAHLLGPIVLFIYWIFPTVRRFMRVKNG